MIAFTKAHACGNDFLIVAEDAVEGLDKSELTQRLCDRNTGIGADGIEFFEWTGDTSGRIHLFNADGSEAEISGNGTRCVAAWMGEELNSATGDQISLETDAGVRWCTLREFRTSDNGGPTTLITTDMDTPTWEETTVELADGTGLEGVFVDMGNPHFVILLSNDSEAPGAPDFSIGELLWQDVGQEICSHPDFPEQTNVEFIRPLVVPAGSPNQVELRIYERGVGPTSSSGTGTCAAAVAMIAVYGGKSPIEVVAPGGIQTVEWLGGENHLLLTGPATIIASGEAW
jgi:diaminopimelate epimerase